MQIKTYGSEKKSFNASFPDLQRLLDLWGHQEVSGFHASLADHERGSYCYLPCESHKVEDMITVGIQLTDVRMTNTVNIQIPDALLPNICDFGQNFCLVFK